MAQSDLIKYGSSVLNRIKDLFSKRNEDGFKNNEQPEHKSLVVALCITCSILLWVFSSMSETYTKILDVDVAVESLPSQEAFVTLPPEEVQVQVQGEGLELLKLYYNPPNIFIDATESQINLIETVSQSLPSNVRIDRVTPPIFILQKEPRLSKKVPIEPQAVIETPSTHDLIIGPTIFPDSVQISGAESIVDDIQKWPTSFFSRSDLTDTLNVELPLVDSLEGLVELSLAYTNLFAVAEQFTEGRRELEVLVRDVPSFQDYITLDPPVLEVRYRVPLSQYRRAQNARDFILSVSYDDIRDDTTGYIRPHLELPEGILFRDVSIVPDKLRYYDVLVDE